MADRMKSLVQTDADRMSGLMQSMAPDVPSGLCLRITDRELEKLGLDDDVEVGDLLHLRIMVQATSVHKTEAGCTIEAAIIAGVVEDESHEGMEDDD